jgi:hypothetical protein
MSVVSRLEPWPPPDEVAALRRAVLVHARAAGCSSGSGSSTPGEEEFDDLYDEVEVVASPYRVCPLGAHIDHQVGAVHAEGLYEVDAADP